MLVFASVSITQPRVFPSARRYSSMKAIFVTEHESLAISRYWLYTPSMLLSITPKHEVDFTSPDRPDIAAPSRCRCRVTTTTMEVDNHIYKQTSINNHNHYTSHIIQDAHKSHSRGW
jgi:hypothetical protein